MIHCYIQMTMRFATTFAHQHFCQTLKNIFPAKYLIGELPHHGNDQKNSAHDSQENCHQCIHHMVFQETYHDIA